jgi:hypothetical protein
MMRRRICVAIQPHRPHNRDMPNVVHEHREAAKELSKLAKPVRQRFDIIRANLEQDPRAPALSPKKETGWGKRTMLGVGFAYQGATYRAAWEIDSAGDGFIWAYGAHEGFWVRVARRAAR